MADTRRRYTRKRKATTVVTAVASSVQAASDATGIPRKTIEYWVKAEEFAELRQKTREEIEEPSKVLAYIALEQIKSRIKEFEPRDLVILFGVMVDKAQLLSGQPTGRTETKTVTEGWNDHERAALRDLIDAELAEREVEA